MKAKPPDILTDTIVRRPRLTGTEPCTRTEAKVQFFHASYDTRRPEVQAALRACRRCPLNAECNIWALARPEQVSDGIFGGTTPRQRLTQRRQLVDRCGDEAAVENVLRRAYQQAVHRRTRNTNP
ncbi:WhiB family transcriptional regulator [Streptomyces sp. N35]|uniref:WhiB family transcriptional regulator n=1 Tax=Streptomyces sp. N35 TaxID=2795730 RepID=UPI0018F2ADF9|nr:WhiB family transcriptional regulator [Streptomyces sp. N35]